MIMNKTLIACDRKVLQPLQSFFMNMPFGAALVDLQGNLLWINHAAEKMFGYTCEEVEGMPVTAFLHPRDEKAVQLVFKDFQQGVIKATEIEIRHAKEDNRFVWVHVSAIAMFDEQNQPSVIAGILHDITSSKIELETLRRRAEELQSMITCSPTCIMLTNEEGRIREWNPAFEQISGIKHNEAVGKAAWEVFRNLIPEEITSKAAEQIKEGIKHILQTGDIPASFHPHQAVIQHTHGDRGYLEVYPFAIKTEQGFRLGVNALVVTQQKHLEDAYEKLINSSMQGIAIFQDEHLVFANPAMSRMTGYTFEELKAMSLEQYYALFHPDDFEAAFRQYQQCLETNQIPFTMELRGVRKDGSVWWQEAQVNIIIYNKKPALQVTMLDITKRVQTHLEAQRQARILQVLAAASSRLIQAEQFERAVLDTLADICTLTQAKRVAVILWQNDGITPLQSFSYSPRNGVSTVDIAELNAASMLRFEWNVHIAPQGFLGVEKDPLTPLWNEEMHAFLQTIAQTLGSAFQQRYLLQTMEQRVKSRTRELNALYELASMTSETLDAHSILQIGLEVLFKVFDRCKGAAFLLDPHLHSLQLTAYKGWQRDKSGEVIYRHLKRFAQKVHNHRGPLLMTQKPIRKKVHNQPLSVQQNFLGITLFSQEHSWGCLCVMAEGHNPFSPEDVALLSAVADQLNRAYERATLQLQFRRMAVNEERQRLGRELHDTVTQGVYSLSLLTSAAQQAMKAGKCTHVERYLEMMEKHTHQIFKEMRLFIYELHPDVFFQEGFVKALARRLELVEQRANINAQYLVEGDINLTEEQEVELYGIAQEALNNSLKHASARSVMVRLRGYKNRITLQIQDDGIGFNPKSPSSQRGYGLVNLQERAKRLNGKLEIKSSSAGTMVQITIPSQRKKRGKYASRER